jgi:hypothetical protein
MQEFAFLFRATRALGPDELSKRNDAARDWVLARNEEGVLRAANPLGDDGFSVSKQGVAPFPREHAVASVLVIRAADLESAVAIARAHPGLAFGTEIEVRPLKAVVVPGATSTRG